MSELRLGLALCGSYCTYEQIMSVAAGLCELYEVTPIMSENSATTDTRFGKSADFRDTLESLSGRTVIDSIKAAEPIGPRALLDVLVIAPCTGNTLAKIASGITDSSVTMAAKAHLRNGRPLVIAVSTNDALTGNAANIGLLMNRKNVYFVPFYQDDAQGKPASLVADFNLIDAAVKAALEGKQLQPVLLVK